MGSTSILNILPVWKDNPDTDYRSVVDTPKLFEFVSLLRDIDSVWVFPFEEAEDIVDTLRHQWAYLFMDGLHLTRQANVTGLPDSLRSLKGAALRLVLERPRLWEYRLFGQVWSDEMEAAQHLKRDLEY